MPDGIIGAASATRNMGAATSAAQRSEKLNGRFLTLLIAQLKNQMPLNPMDSSKMTSQIAQVNMVSGINKLNTTLSSITDQINTTQRLQASALIGRNVLVPGDEISVGPTNDGQGTATTPYGVELAQPAKKVEITIINGQGETVRKFTETNVAAGVHAYSWNGKNAAGDPVPAKGSYSILVKAVSYKGEQIGTRPLSMALVNGVVVSDNGPKLDLGPNGMATLADIRQIIS